MGIAGAFRVKFMFSIIVPFCKEHTKRKMLIALQPSHEKWARRQQIALRIQRDTFRTAYYSCPVFLFRTMSICPPVRALTNKCMIVYFLTPDGV